ncbi:MAG: hypothetical protein JXB00_04950 [Bacteroidales bacterium]|nr:hypothetical protein [Bacteroidales bacterium]
MRGYFSFLIKFIAAVLFFSSPPGKLAGQGQDTWSPYALEKYFARLYKQDQNLVNGMKYYNLHYSATGNPFLISEKSSEGWINLNGVEYRDILLKYDICNQQVILEYTYSHGGMNQVVLSNEFISEFELLGKRFKKYHFSLTGEKYFQVITSGSLTLLIEWKKDLLPAGSFSNIAYEYSREKKKMYLLKDSLPLPLKGNGSFLKLFPGNEAAIRKYMKQNQVKLKTAGDTVLGELLGYCSQFFEKPKQEASDE